MLLEHLQGIEKARHRVEKERIPETDWSQKDASHSVASREDPEEPGVRKENEENLFSSSLCLFILSASSSSLSFAMLLSSFPSN